MLQRPLSSSAGFVFVSNYTFHRLQANHPLPLYFAYFPKQKKTRIGFFVPQNLVRRRHLRMIVAILKREPIERSTIEVMANSTSHRMYTGALKTCHRASRQLLVS